ncbi:uncharacterized protein LOC115030387 [Mus caroli]|uniref:Uncharacterized protein LOC115030387 n=1 Tax=Mus caroli TaxID=10089 RepID=A0A6P7QMK1_MUSCR|nr:uncharacterized protein LOC115030387 [Mus caroli]
MLDGFQQTEDVSLGLSDHGEDKAELNPKSASVIKPRDGELLSTFYIDKRVPGAEEPEEQGLESYGTGITNICEQSHGYWESVSDLLENTSCPLKSPSHLSSSCFIFYS